MMDKQSKKTNIILFKGYYICYTENYGYSIHNQSLKDYFEPKKVFLTLKEAKKFINKHYEAINDKRKGNN